MNTPYQHTQPTHKPHWQALAACLGIDPDIMYPDNDDDRGILEATRYCAVCPVVEQCTEFAMDFESSQHSRAGIWGGLTPAKRERLKFSRQHAARRARKAVLTPA